MSAEKQEYDRIMLEIRRGSNLVWMTGKKLYNNWISWFSTIFHPEWKDLNFHEQKAWIFASYGINASIEEEDEMV